MKKILFLVIIFLTCFAGLANALTYIPGVTNSETTGFDMDGILVTVNFSGGGNETLEWSDSGLPSAPGVSGTGWSLSVVGSTFYNPWTFEAAVAIDSFSINAYAGDVLFDNIWMSGSDPAYTEHTPGSENGYHFNAFAPPGVSVTSTYSNELAVVGHPSYGDAWGQLGVTFNGEVGFIGTGGNALVFGADTDNLVVPEPSTLLLLGCGLLGLARWRKKKAS